MKKYTLIVLAVVVGLFFSQAANASLSVSLADLTGLTLDVGRTTGHSGSGSGPFSTAITIPAYADTSAMSGAVGAMGDLDGLTPGPAGAAYYSFSAATLISLNAQLLIAADSLGLVGYNDNDETWRIGIWADQGAGDLLDFSDLGAGTSSVLSIALTGPLSAAGVYVENITSAPDGFHASWNVPEATSFLIWGGLAMAGATVRRRRRS